MSRWRAFACPRIVAQTLEEQDHVMVTRMGRVVENIRRVEVAYPGSNSEDIQLDLYEEYLALPYLIGHIKSKQPVDTSESILRNNATFYAAFLGDDIEQFLECPFECKDLLDVRTLRDQ